MSKRMTKIELGQPTVPLQPAPEARKESQQQMAEDTSDDQAMNADEATKLAIKFLKSLGVKKTIPNRASNEGSRSLVELDLDDKKAAVVLDGKTKEILEYEIEKVEKPRAEGGGSLPLKWLLILVGLQFGLIILFNFIKPYIPFLP